MKMSRVFAKLVSFGERRRSLIPIIGFVAFVLFVVETKEHDCFFFFLTFANERATLISLFYAVNALSFCFLHLSLQKQLKTSGFAGDRSGMSECPIGHDSCRQ